MSFFGVLITKITSIKDHSNADSLSIAQIYGFQVVVRKGIYTAGQKVVYCPIDAILPKELEDKIFPPDAKVKLHNSRVRQIKIRGLASQGMLLPTEHLPEAILSYPEGSDVASLVGITKYEPPETFVGQTLGTRKQRKQQLENPLFHSYGGLENVKWFPDLFNENTDVFIEEKLHGTNARIGFLPTHVVTLKQKIMRFFGLLPKMQVCYGSNKVELTNKQGHTGFYGEDLWARTFEKQDVAAKAKQLSKEFLCPVILYGEIIGDGIQKNYSYDLKNGNSTFVLFDVKLFDEKDELGNLKGRFLNRTEVFSIAAYLELPIVPLLFEGKFNVDEARKLTFGPSIFAPGQKVREGVVIKALDYNDERGNKKALKLISEDYLNDRTNTDNH